MNLRVRPARHLRGEVRVPGDKSVSHRAALLGAAAEGLTEVRGFLEGEDCLATLTAVTALGAEVSRKGPGHYAVRSPGLGGLSEPDDVIDCGNSGTTARLLLGLLAGQPFAVTLTGDGSLRRRPMDRVVEPLGRMGMRAMGRSGDRRLPLTARGRRPLSSIHHTSPVASAQVKSAILLAGLQGDGPTSVTEPAVSRDHTERMLVALGADLTVEDRTVTVRPGPLAGGGMIRVPGDVSSAAFFLVAGALAPEGEVTLREVGVNPTRTGVLEVLAAMGADIARRDASSGAGEPVADLVVRPGQLAGTEVAGALVPRAIDELPILAVAAAAGEGWTEVRDAAELRVKESDRIAALASELGRLGVRIEERPDGFRIEGRGGRPFRGARVRSFGDHRLAMALVVAGLSAEGETVVEDVDCIATSFPRFIDICRELAGPDSIETEA